MSAADRSQGTDRPPGPITPRRPGPRFATAAERALAAEWALRQYTAGRRQYDIAADLGVAQSTVSDLISQAIRERKGLAVDELREVRADTYRGLVASLAPYAVEQLRSAVTGERLYDYDGTPLMAPNLDVIARIESLTDKLSRLEGSVAPVKVQVSKSDVDAKIEALAEEIAARSRGPVPQEG